MNFNDINWHDSVVKKLIIDRNNPGINDIIELEIEWKDGQNGSLFFEGVYWTNFTLNFGIVSLETILDASSLPKDDDDLINLYANWKGLIDDVDLTAYVINLNSTGGRIKIIAKGFRLKQNK